VGKIPCTCKAAGEKMEGRTQKAFHVNANAKIKRSPEVPVGETRCNHITEIPKAGP